MTILFLALWLQMSAPTMPCQSAKLYYGGVLVDEEPHCGLLNQVINMPTALDNITRQELAEAAQRAADETDGKPCANDLNFPCCKNEHDYDCIIRPKKSKAEPVDVPAVQVGTRLGCEVTAEMCIDHLIPIYSCKDKSRILEHDENSPPKYWCRKLEF